MSMSKFTVQEVEALQKGGNQVKSSIQLVACLLVGVLEFPFGVLVHILTLKLNDTASQRIIVEGFRYPAKEGT